MLECNPEVGRDNWLWTCKHGGVVVTWLVRWDEDSTDPTECPWGRERRHYKEVRAHLKRVTDPANQSHHAPECSLKLGHSICECDCGLTHHWVVTKEYI